MTAYRDENEAMRARLAEAERELGEAKARIARLEGHVETDTRAPDFLVGAPLRLHLETEIDGRLDAEGLARLARTVRSRMGLTPHTTEAGIEARATGDGALLGERALSVQTRGDKTIARLRSDLDRLPVVVAMGPVLGALFSIPYVLWQMSLRHPFEERLETLAATMSVVATISVLSAIATRWAAKRHAIAIHARDRGVWATAVEAMQESARHAARVRVATAVEGARVQGTAVEGTGEEQPEGSEPSARAAERT